MTNQPKQPEWEIKFKKEIMCHCEGEDFDSNHTVSNPTTIKDFIRQLLANQKKQLLSELGEKVEGMKKIDKRGVKTCDCTEYEGCGCKVRDFNQALDKVKELLKEIK